jgi:hypothetical protein
MQRPVMFGLSSLLGAESALASNLGVRWPVGAVDGASSGIGQQILDRLRGELVLHEANLPNRRPALATYCQVSGLAPCDIVDIPAHHGHKFDFE